MSRESSTPRESQSETARLFQVGSIIEDNHGHQGVVKSKWIEKGQAKIRVKWIGHTLGGTGTHVDSVTYFYKMNFRPTGEVDELTKREENVRGFIMSRFKVVHGENPMRIPQKLSTPRLNKFLDAIFAKIDWQNQDPSPDEIDAAIYQYFADPRRQR